MGTLLSIHKDILKVIIGEYLAENEIILLALSVGIKLPITSDFIARAVYENHNNILKWARKQGCPFGSISYQIAVKNGNLKVLKYLVKNYDTDRSFINQNSFSAFPVVFDAIWEKQIEILKWLKTIGYKFHRQGSEYIAMSYSISPNTEDEEIKKWVLENVRRVGL